VGRQPIYDRSSEVTAYELLFRDAATAVGASVRDANATSQVITAAFTEFGLDQLVGQRDCFLNVTREFLVGELPLPFTPKRVVLEILETVTVDDETIAGATRLAGQGFRIALDDYVGGAHEQLLDVASYVKVDVLDTDPDTVAETVRLCRKHGGLHLIAERLETDDQLQFARDAGFDYFQGYVLGRPEVFTSAGVHPGRMNRLRLLTALTAVDVDFDDVVALITQDPTLTYRLLRATNAASTGVAVRVSSVREAAILLGLEKVRHWVTLMLISDLADATEDQLARTMTRARVCQLIAESIHLRGDAAFTTGVLSGIAELLGQPASVLAAQLPLSDQVQEALATGTGPLGRILGLVIDYEHGRFTAAADALRPAALVHAYLSALGWSTLVLGGLTDTSRPGRSPRR
jgi:c-di-GMP-related signal transduction protein